MTVYWIRPATLFTFIFFVCGTNGSIESSTEACSEEEGKPHDCVSIIRCPSLYPEVLKPAEMRNNEMLRRSKCGFDTGMPKVCCPRKVHKNLYLLTQHKCGQDTGMMAGGQVAELNEFPWMALLSYQVGNERKFQCGGSLINDKYVLTAAHCLSEYLLGVRIGEHTIHTKKDCVNFLGIEYCAEHVQDFRIAKTVVHDKYNIKAFSNDIALIRLEGTVNVARANAKPICLPITPNTMELNLTNLTMTVAGWGASEDSSASDVLKKVHVPVVSNEDCEAILYYLASKKLCAGKLEKNSCIGDSGGPLISFQKVERKLVYVQFGIVSYGASGQCGSGNLGVYTRVTEYMDWILDHLEP